MLANREHRSLRQRDLDLVGRRGVGGRVAAWSKSAGHEVANLLGALLLETRLSGHGTGLVEDGGAPNVGRSSPR